MNYTDDQINRAVNAADMVEKPSARASEPVTITQECLCTLTEAARKWLEMGVELRNL